MVWKSQQIGPPRSSNCTKTNSVETVGLDNFLVLLKNDLSTKLEVVLRQQQINTKNGNEPKNWKHIHKKFHLAVIELKILSANHRHMYQLKRRL